MFAQYHTLNLLYSTMVYWYSENKQSQTNSDFVIDFYTNIFTINNINKFIMLFVCYRCFPCELGMTVCFP